jgi:hypothetical protein
MPIRFPFRRAGPAEPVDDNQRTAADASFEKTPVSGTKPKDIKEPVEYKLSGKEPIAAFTHIATLGTAGLALRHAMRLHYEQRSVTAASSSRYETVLAFVAAHVRRYRD